VPHDYRFPDKSLHHSPTLQNPNPKLFNNYTEFLQILSSAPSGQASQIPMDTSMSTLSPSQSGTTFHHFPLLPAELRTQIWTYAAFEPRYLKLEYTEKGNKVDYFYICNPAPVLYACQESRSQALVFYRKAFSVRGNPRYIWVNFAVDTIELLDIRVSSNNLERDDLNRIERLVVNVEEQHVFVHRTVDRLRFHPPLKDIVILSFYGVSNWDAEDIIEATRRMRSWYDWKKIKCPRMRIRELYTGVEMDLLNHQALLQGEVIGSFQRMRRGRGLGDFGLVESDTFASSATTVEHLIPDFMFQE
jgi:hypothetical protein